METSQKILKILLCSTSDIKEKAILDFFNARHIPIEITKVNCDDLGLPAQPLVNGYLFAVERVLHCRRKMSEWDNYDVIIAIENYISIANPKLYEHYDFCHVVVYNCKTNRFHHTIIPHENIESLCLKPVLENQSGFIGYLVDYTFLMKDQSMTMYSKTIYGFDTTYGEKLVTAGKATNAKNWMRELTGVDRTVQIKNSLEFAWNDYVVNLDRKPILTLEQYADFPKVGVQFEDMFSGLCDWNQLCIIKSSLLNYIHNLSVNYVVGLESRGFILGGMISGALDIPFIPVRKAGKLPGETVSVTYTTEYSTDTFEMQKYLTQFDKKNRRVIIIDDIVATGGSIKAAIDLLKQLDATVVDIIVLKEVPSLRQIAKEKIGLPYTVLF